ncbi:MAG: Ldh family oxidoreductase, partial [Nitrospinota bacterium]
MPVIQADRLETLAEQIFAALGAPEEHARRVATLLVRANLRGHDSHGVIRIPQYVTAVKEGAVNPRAKIQVVAETPTTARVDGDLGFGQVVASRATEMAVEKAKTQGLSAVGCFRTNHIGRLADYAELAATQGVIAALWVNAPMALHVAPWGGAARRLGTNPHAVAIPGPDGVAMSLDMATSV